jgi:hypothetical protein
MCQMYTSSGQALATVAALDDDLQSPSPQHSVGGAGVNPLNLGRTASGKMRVSSRIKNEAQPWALRALGLHAGAPRTLKPKTEDLLLQVFHGASRTRTGDLLGAIQWRYKTRIA